MPIEPDQPDPSASPEHYDTNQMANVASAVRDIRHPKQIGPYQVQGVIGEGGMGTVYRALQREPIHRTVAIKIIKLGMDTREVIARFDAERQALALMNHTNVAKVLDAGATETGRPYFVMEYFKGEPITAYADRHKLTVKNRLELFMQACDAVQHAHHKAIIHRDLKPSNILVTEESGKPTVKVIDFGVAKALSQRLTEKTLFTTTGQLVGTPEYMAPEQADSSAPDVDTRTDVYSLGVVLYELLSGGLPFDAETLRSAGYNEIQRIIREVDPPRPHTRLTKLGVNAEEVARRRSVALESLTHQLKSELEWIPLKAMRKERAQRYASPTELAEDLRNYLNNRPLRAGPESASYRAKKFVRRNKTGIAASAVMLLLLVAGIITTSWQAIRANREKREAQIASENLSEVNKFLTEDLLGSAAPEVSLGKEITVREAVDRAADTIATRFANRPQIEATVRLALAETYDALGYVERALPHAKQSSELFRRTRGQDADETLAASHEYARELIHVNRAREAEVILRDVIARATRKHGADDRSTIGYSSALALSLRYQDRLDEAETIYRRILSAHQKMFGPQTEQVATSLSNVALISALQGRVPEAEQMLEQALEIRRSVLPPDHPYTLSTISNLARLYEDQRRFNEAERLHREVLAAKRRVMKDDHPSTTTTMLSLATVLVDLKRYDEAEALTREAYEIRNRVSGPDNLDTLLALNNLAYILNLKDKPAEAEVVFRDVIERRKRALGETHEYTVATQFNLLRTLIAQRKYQDADELFAVIHEPERFNVLLPDQQGLTLYYRGTRLVEQGKLAEAEATFTDALSYLRKSDYPVGDDIQNVLRAQVSLYEKLARPADAARVRAELAAPTTATSRSIK